MADNDPIVQMVQDPMFQKADFATQKQALAAHDPLFAKASDADISQFIKAHGVTTAQPDAWQKRDPIAQALSPQVAPEQGFLNRAGQALTGAASGIYNTVVHPLASMSSPLIPQSTPYGTPTIVPTGNGAVDQTNQQFQQQQQQATPQVLAQNAQMVTEHPAYMAGSVAGPLLAGKAVATGMGMLGEKPIAPGYSLDADKLASVTVADKAIDKPAVLNRAIPALKEAAADLGLTGDSFKAGYTEDARTKVTLAKTVVDHALNLHEERIAPVIDAIKGDQVDPKILKANPALASEFPDGANVTYGQVWSLLRDDLNKGITRSNLYRKNPAQQVAIADNLAQIRDAANEARAIVYGYGSEKTGVDIRPLQKTDSALIQTKNIINSTANALSEAQANYESTSLGERSLRQIGRVGGSLFGPGRFGVGTNLGSAAVSELPALLSPTHGFVSTFANIFSDVKPQPANLDLGLNIRQTMNPVNRQFGNPTTLPEGTTAYPDVTKPAVARNPLGLPNPGQPAETVEHPELTKTELKGLTRRRNRYGDIIGGQR